MTKDEIKEKEPNVNFNNGSENEKKSFKREKNRFEFALFINDFLICKRNFPINGYVEKSMQSPEFKAEVDKIVSLIDEDLKSKTRIYSYYHLPEFKFKEETVTIPEWEPEMCKDPLIDEGVSTFKFIVYDDGREVISKTWDGRYYPNYVRKSVDLTNKQVKIIKGEKVSIYDKEKFFDNQGTQLFGELYVLRQMIYDKEDLIPKIQKLIYEVCSSFDGYYEKTSDYQTVVEYRNCDFLRDESGNPILKQKMSVDENGNEVPVFDGLGRPWMEPVYDKAQKGKKYNFNIDAHNKKIDSMWGALVIDKTRKYMSELYVSPKEKFFKKKED